MDNLSRLFIRWGTGLLALGLLTGYGPLNHYLAGGVDVSCPWAPVHGHTILLGWVAFTIFGLVYRVLPEYDTPSRAAVRIGKGHLWLSIVAVLGVYGNGIFGYRYLDRISPGFYYEPDEERLRLWLSIDGMFLTLFAIGCILFMLAVFSSTGRRAQTGP